MTLNKLLPDIIVRVVLWAFGLTAPGHSVVMAAPAIVASPERMFDWQDARCARWDIPDTPARAWRGPDGEIHLVTGSEHSRAAVGPELGQLTRDCTILHQGAGLDDPGAYDDRLWIASVFSTGGLRVEALAHVEYHGHLRPEICATARYAPCWRNSIVQLVSYDGGRSFARAGSVATLPYRYDSDASMRQGYFNPSNILHEGDHLFTFIFSEATRAQKRGACLLRRPVDGNADDWRAWDGTGFRTAFVDPYRTDVTDPGAHVCTPLKGISSTISGVVRHVPSGLYLAVTPATRTGQNGVAQSGIFWMKSPDLINWSTPELLLEVPLLWRRDCAESHAFAYPSILDNDSPSPNFDTVDDRFWLYLVEMSLMPGCKIGPDRDLIRFEVNWPVQ